MGATAPFETTHHPPSRSRHRDTQLQKRQGKPECRHRCNESQGCPIGLWSCYSHGRDCGSIRRIQQRHSTTRRRRPQPRGGRPPALRTKQHGIEVALAQTLARKMHVRSSSSHHYGRRSDALLCSLLHSFLTANRYWDFSFATAFVGAFHLVPF